MAVRVIHGEAREVLRQLQPESVHCVVTSPPYWALRDFGVPSSVWGGDPSCAHEWEAYDTVVGPAGSDWTQEVNGRGERQGTDKSRMPRTALVTSDDCPRCGAWRGQLGLEPEVGMYVRNIVEVFREVYRVLRPDGSLWLNIGDCYVTKRGGGQGANGLLAGKTVAKRGVRLRRGDRRSGSLPYKSLVGVPWRAALALQDDGWILRNDIVWEKPNCQPECVRDRSTHSHEYVFHFVKGQRYFYDYEALKEPVSGTAHPRGKGLGKKARHSVVEGRQNPSFQAAVVGLVEHRNSRTVWRIPTEPYKGAHFATFPRALARRCLAAGCPPAGWALDPFGGSGVTGVVADEQGKNAILIELSPESVGLAHERLAASRASGTPREALGAG